MTISRGAATDPRDRSKGMYASAIAPVVAGDLGDNARVETHDALGHFGAFYTLVPIRPRSRGERLFLRTFPGASLRLPLAFNPRPRRLSTPLLTPFNSTPTFARMERPSGPLEDPETYVESVWRHAEWAADVAAAAATAAVGGDGPIVAKARSRM